MATLLLVAGLILLLAVSASWATTAGIICLVVFGVLIAARIVGLVLVGLAASNPPRNRRGF